MPLEVRFEVQHLLQPLQQCQNGRKNDPAQQLAKLVTGSGQQRGYFVADFAGKITTHTIVALQMTDRRFDGRATF